MLTGFSNKETGLEYLETILRYVASGTDTLTPEDLGRNVVQIFERNGGDIMATLAEQWIEEGIQRGIQKGHEQGMLQDAREMVYEAISSKFGAVPEDISEKVKKIQNRETLRALLRQAIVSETVDRFREALKRLEKSSFKC